VAAATFDLHQLSFASVLKPSKAGVACPPKSVPCGVNKDQVHL